MTRTISQERHFAIVPVWVIYSAELHASDIRVYATLSERAGTKRRSWPGIRRIAADTHMAKSTVQESVKRLEAFGAIEIDRSLGRSNTYWLPKDRTDNRYTTVPIVGTDRADNQDTAVPTIGTELDPVNYTKELAAGVDFEEFHEKRAAQEAMNRQSQGYQVRSPQGLAQTIAFDTRFRVESSRIWAHRECKHCDHEAMTSIYSPAVGSVSTPCERKPK